MKTYVIILFTLLTTFFVNSQCSRYLIYESFSSSLPTQGGTWTSNSISSVTTPVRTGTYAAGFDATGDWISTPMVSNPGVLSFWYRRSNNSTAWVLNIQTSTNGTTWTTRGSITTVTTTYAQYSLDLESLGLSNVYVRLVDARSSGTHVRYVDDFSITSSNSNENVMIPAITNCSQTISSSITYTFTDIGGPTDTYNNSMTQTITFSPGTVGKKVEINFSSIVGEMGGSGTLYDYIRVYNGPNTSSTLIGTYTSTPGNVITSTASGGELTVKFTSDGSTINSGWVSTVYLVGDCVSPTSLSLSSTSSTSANMSWVASTSNPSSGYEWEVRTSGVGGSGSTGLTASGSVSAGVTSSSTSSLTQNTTYTLYVRSNCGSGEYSSWVASSSMTTPYTPPTNDDPTNAIQISVSNDGIYTTYSNASSTSTTTESTPTCGGYSGEDVWFKVVVPNNVTILDFDTQTGDITDGAMSIYRGTIGSLTQIECDDDDGLDGLMPWIYREDFTPGETIYLRFWEYNGGTVGTFKLNVSTPEALPVELLYFEGVKYPTFNSLRWVTVSEHNSSHFIIERSIDGESWDFIGNKNAAGNSQSKINYFYLDNYTNQVNVYYRLVQYDVDGKFKIYGPIIIQGSSTKRIVRYINSLGQEVNPTTKGVIFEVYEDGTMKKIIR